MQAWIWIERREAPKPSLKQATAPPQCRAETARRRASLAQTRTINGTICAAVPSSPVGLVFTPQVKKVKRKGLILTASQVLKSERDSNRKAPPVRERCHLQHLFRALQSLMLVSQVTHLRHASMEKAQKGDAAVRGLIQESRFLSGCPAPVSFSI
jgi:hypothetical protein